MGAYLDDIYLKYCPTKDKIAHVLTKPLANDGYEAFTQTMG